MSTQLFNGTLLSKKTGTVLTALAAIVLSGSSVWAALTPQQGEITNNISILEPGKTILTAKATVLAQAVAQAILSDTTGSSKAQLAEAAFGYVPTTSGSAVRSDRDSSAAVVTGSAVNVLIGDTNVNLATLQTDVAAITDGVAIVNGANTAANLSVSGQEAVVKTALEVIANASAPAPFVNPNPSLSATSYNSLDQAIGAALANNTNLTNSWLVTLLQTAIVGVDGVKVGSNNYPTATPVNIPAEAAAFVEGIVSTNVPAVTGTSFDVAILKNVAKNTTADELIAYQIGEKDGTGALTGIATALFKAYPSAIAKITQGLTAVVAKQPNTESARVSFVESLLPAQGSNLPETKNVTAILQGAVFTDPVFAGQFTAGIFSTLAQYTTLNSHGQTVLTGSAALSSDAAAIATAIGGVLGQDGDALTRVASVYSDAIAVHTLKVSNAATYASDLIIAATKGLPASNFMVNPGYSYTALSSGSTLQVGTGTKNAPVTGFTVHTPVANDLVNIEDLFANAIVLGSGTATADTKAGATTIGGQLGTLAADIAKITKNEVFVSSTGTVPVSQYLGATLADYVVSLGLNAVVTTGAAPTAQDIIIAAIEKDLKGVMLNTVANPYYNDTTGAIAAVVNNTGSSRSVYQFATGPIGTAETAITNF